MKVLEVKDLWVRLGGRDVLRGVTLEVYSSCVCTVIGPNGAGKTTLLRSILGIVKPVRGVVKILGKELSRFSRVELARTVAMAAVERVVGFNLTVLDVLEMSLYPVETGIDRYSAIEAIAKEFGIEHLLNRKISTLSAGELQLVSIASAFIRRPKLVLLDEPTTHLDPAHRVRVLEIIRRKAREGISVLMVLHDPRAAYMYSDYIVALKSGRVVAAGKPSEVVKPNILSELYDTEIDVIEHPKYGPFIVSRSEQMVDLHG